MSKDNISEDGIYCTEAKGVAKDGCVIIHDGKNTIRATCLKWRDDDCRNCKVGGVPKTLLEQL